MSGSPQAWTYPYTLSTILLLLLLSSFEPMRLTRVQSFHLRPRLIKYYLNNIERGCKMANNEVIAYANTIWPALSRCHRADHRGVANRKRQQGQELRGAPMPRYRAISGCFKKHLHDLQPLGKLIDSGLQDNVMFANEPCVTPLRLAPEFGEIAFSNATKTAGSVR